MKPCKTPTPAPAALPGTTASPHQAGEAGCRYPSAGLRQDRALLPSWAEPAQVASPWEVRPGAPPAPMLWQRRGPGAGRPEPSGMLGRQARRSRGGAAILASPPSLESALSASALWQPGTWWLPGAGGGFTMA